MDGMDSDIEVSAEQLAVIAAGMRIVALADGDIHPAELQMIQALEEGLPPLAAIGSAREVLDSESLLAIYLRSLWMVALADGKASPGEVATLRHLAEEAGCPAALIDAVGDEVKHAFMGQLAGVTLFTEGLDEIAADIGLAPNDWRS